MNHKRRIAMVAALLLLFVGGVGLREFLSDKGDQKLDRSAPVGNPLLEGHFRPSIENPGETAPSRVATRVGANHGSRSAETPETESPGIVLRDARNRDHGAASLMLDSHLRIRPSPEFELPGLAHKDFVPGPWLEIRNSLEFLAGEGSVPFMVRLEMRFANGAAFQALVEADTIEGAARIFLSPATFRRLAGTHMPTTGDVVWFALTDLGGGERRVFGKAPANPPAERPPSDTLRALNYEETPFLSSDLDFEIVLPAKGES